MQNTSIYRETLNDTQRLDVPARLFGGAGFAFKVEPSIYAMADALAKDYEGGYWDMFSLSNGGFYMAPSGSPRYTVTSMNGYSGQLSADALGITVCLFTYSHLSFGSDALAETCAEQYHWLREWAMEHAEVGVILAATD